MLHYLPSFTARWRSGAMSDAAYAAVYFLLWQIERHRGRFASRRSKNDPRPDAPAWLADIEHATSQELPGLLADWFRHYQFQGVIPNVPAALYHWLTGAWPLRLLECIPAPRDVLRMQAEGARPVTVFSEFPRLMQPVLGKADAFAFMIHDLEHAYKLLYEPSLYQGQMAFFARLRDCLDGFEPYLEDAAFAAKFDYLISDMNTHPAHSLQYLKAILLDWHLRWEGKAASDRVSAPAWAAIEGLLEDSGLRAAADLREPACRT